ncbi:shikimate kinase [Flavobacterium sp.]|uniref:shikimate kinase n=1 Tax=Flavobacterium sp. TaxID=239 RepID=UPI003753742C
MKKVVFIGYMGCGKSLISKELGVQINIRCLDLDNVIENYARKSITDLFKSKGELYFRKLENELLKEILNANESLILSTGGGTPCYYNNIEIINNPDVTSVYLKASIETLFERLVSEKNKRPLISNFDDADLKEFIAKHLFERSFYYNQAKYIINVDTKSIEEIITELKNIIYSK